MAPSAFEFTLNGEALTVEGFAANTTLLQYLRATGKTGTKEGCAEGDCGACTVAVVEADHEGRRTYRAINSCITLLPMVAGREVVTAEGVGRGGPHPVQASMVEHYGSQCGYCTPGFVVSMFEAYYRDDIKGREQLVDQLNGNLCRCTGYRPIRDAMVAALEARARRPAPDLFQISLRKPAAPLAPLDYAARGERFVRPTSLDELVRLRAEHPEAVLVAGATEVGVDVTKKARRFPLLISTEGVEALRRVERRPDAFRVGGAATLTALEEGLAGEVPAVDKMLWAFASRQIRNRATLAGNLVTASPIGDMAPLLLALDASIELRSARGARALPLAEFFTGYRRTALAADEIVEAVVIPRRPAERRRVESYKVSKRRELDISIVAAAFAVELSEAGLVRHARLAYGGVAPRPVRAERTEAFLAGKPWTAETVRAALPLLEAEFSPIDDVRSGAPFRRGLVASLFEKFFAGESSQAQDEKLSFETGEPLEGPEGPGRRLAHESAEGHVSGRALYVDDEACRRPALVMWPVCSPHARARIVRRDAGAARAMPGVAAVLLAEDIPGLNDVGGPRRGEILLARDEALFHGHMVAVVVGDSYEACRAAAAKVEVDYEPRTPLLGLRQAIAAGSYHTKPHVIRRGDADAAIAASPHELEGELEIGGQEHFYLESQAAHAEAGDDGDVIVTSSTQHPSEIQEVVSHVLGLPRHKVVVRSPRMGGGFGGKETQGASWAALTALAAVRLGRPVRWQLDRDLDMALTGKRHPFFARYRAGFDAEGRVLGARVELVSDGGWALDLSESICDRALFHLDNAYYLPAVHFSGRVAKTNAVSHTAFRGFGGPQGMVVIEEILDRVARRLGLPPEAVRERNLYRGEGETNTTHYGQHIDDNRLEAIWQSLKRSTRLDERRAEVARFNAASGRVKRGLAVTPVKFGISFTASFLNQAGALVLIYRDGTAQVNHGGTEMGQGLYTKILGIAMRELGLPAERVRVMKTQTDKVPNTSATAASSGSDLNGAAVKAACDELRGRLAPVAADLLERRHGARVDPGALRFEGGRVHAPGGAAIDFAEAVEAAYIRQTSLSATGFYRTPGLAYDKAAGKGHPFHYFAFGAALAEVEVDGYSGMKRVLSVDILHDVGDSLNPGVDRGQIEGGFVQGMGWLTGEELKWDAAGRLMTHSASTYQIPSIGDAPPRFRVQLLPRAAQGNTIHGSKAVGEPPLMLAIAVREAIRDAIAAFGEPGGEVDLPSPATHEAIFHAVRARLARAAAPAEEEAAEE
ncbi:MAG TPA: xanthine dehydrogenase molybdopterin binding subunit [Polyangiaceae bacterium]|nr:xanthine dehydrogenase molybdopterin binding subunit [Polyangiaceae bacterium]